MTENGDNVTRAELMAHLNPIKSDIWEIKSDVKILLRNDAGTIAVSNWKKFWVGAFGIAFLGLIVTVVTLAIQVAG
jgi:hypothetical protein